MTEIKSATLKCCYKEWQKTATPEQIRLVDDIYNAAESHYSAGGDVIVECFTPEDILRKFNTVAQAQYYCDLRVEQELNTRWGEDDDTQLKRYQDFNDSGEW